MSLASTASADDLIGNLKTSIAESLVPSGITPVWWIAPVCAIVALVAALICYKLMIKEPKGNSTMEVPDRRFLLRTVRFPRNEDGYCGVQQNCAGCQ